MAFIQWESSCCVNNNFSTRKIFKLWSRQILTPVILIIMWLRIDFSLWICNDPCLVFHYSILRFWSEEMSENFAHNHPLFNVASVWFFTFELQRSWSYCFIAQYFMRFHKREKWRKCLVTVIPALLFLSWMYLRRGKKKPKNLTKQVKSKSIYRSFF